MRPAISFFKRNLKDFVRGLEIPKAQSLVCKRTFVYGKKSMIPRQGRNYAGGEFDGRRL